MDDSIKVTGRVRIRTWDLIDGIWQLSSDTRTDNLVVDLGLNRLAAAESNNALSTQIDYVALGNGTTAVAGSDTQLDDERFRKQVTAYTTGNNTGEVITTVYVSPAEANGFVINEIGWFITSDAADPSAENAGLLVARIEEAGSGSLPLFAGAAKTNTQAVQIDRTTTYS